MVVIQVFIVDVRGYLNLARALAEKKDKIRVN